MSGRSMRQGFATGLAAAVVAAAALCPAAARAEVRHEGDWSDDDDEVTLDLDNVPRDEAVKRLADKAEWSVVIHAPKGDPVRVHVKDQPADKVLDMILSDGSYVARRDENRIDIAPDTGAPPLPALAPVPPVPPVPPLSPLAGDGSDRAFTGGNGRIDAGEVVHDVSVMGGNLDVYGAVTGKLTVMGGNVRLHPGARVEGDVHALGGNLVLEDGSLVEGDVGVLGGALHREDGAQVEGSIHDGMRWGHWGRWHAHRNHAAQAGAAPSKPPPPRPPVPVASKAKSLAHRVADALNGAALFFVFGAVLLALAPDRMERMRVQVAAHPMKSFATGVVSLLLGLVAGPLVCLTIIGIPFVVLGLLAAIFATLAGMCSVFETLGGALLAHRTKNPYVYLACGGLLFLIAGAIPFVGGLVKVAVVLTALGSAVATRGAGLVPPRVRFGAPYRASAVPADV